MNITAHRRADQSGQGRIASGSDLAPLRYLPVELLDIVKRLSPHAWLWRFLSVLDLSCRAPSTVQPLRTFALDDIEAWKRGDDTPTISGDKRSAVRITIDSDGIRNIERLCERPAFSQTSSSDRAYIVEEVATISGVKAHTKVYAHNAASIKY